MSGCAKCGTATQKRLCRNCSLEAHHGVPEDHMEDDDVDE